MTFHIYLARGIHDIQYSPPFFVGDVDAYLLLHLFLYFMLPSITYPPKLLYLPLLSHTHTSTHSHIHKHPLMYTLSLTHTHTHCSHRLLVFSLSVVQHQHTLIRASQLLTPSLQDSYDTLVWMAEGEKGVAWADQSNLSSDGLLDVSTSNFTQSQHALFDNLLVSASPRTRYSDVGCTLGTCSSPFPISTSLGILASTSVANTSHSGTNTPLSRSARAVDDDVASITLKSFQLKSDGITTPSALLQRRQLQQEANKRELASNSSNKFGSSPFIHRTTVSASGVKCETSIGGVKAVAIATSSGQANNLMSQLSHTSGHGSVQISTSAGLSEGVAKNSSPARTTTPAKATTPVGHLTSMSRSHYTLDETESGSMTNFHSHYEKSGSDTSSSQGSTSMYSTQCVVTNHHAHIPNCYSPRKLSDPEGNSGTPRNRFTAHTEPMQRPKSANDVLHSSSSRAENNAGGRPMAFTPVRGSASNLQTPLFQSSRPRSSQDHNTLPLVSPSIAKQQHLGAGTSTAGGLGCTRTDSGYSTSFSEVSRNGNDVASPYLIPHSGTTTATAMRTVTSSSCTRQPAFQAPSINTKPNTINTSSSCQVYTSTSLSSQNNPPSHITLNTTSTLSQQSQSPSVSSDGSTNCVVDLNTSSRPRPAFQLSQDKAHYSASRLTNSQSSPNISMPHNVPKQVRTPVLATRNFCSFEDNFVSPQSSFCVPKTPVGASTTTVAEFNRNSSLSSHLQNRIIPPTASVSSRNNYLSTSYHREGTSAMRSPMLNSYYNSGNLSSYMRTNPNSTSVSSDLRRNGARSAPHSLSGRLRSDMPTPSPGSFVTSYPHEVPPTTPPPVMLSPIPHESHSDSTDTGSHIYQTIEPAPPPLPPPRSRNIYVPRPQGTPNGSWSRPYEARSYLVQGGMKPTLGETNALNETFTIEPDSYHTKMSPYHNRQLRPTSAPNSDHRLGKSTNPYVQCPPHHPSQSVGTTRCLQRTQGMERKLPSYLQMTKSAASKRVPR